MVKDVNEHNRVSQDLETYESIESNQNKAKEPRLNWDSSFKGGLSGIFEKNLPPYPTHQQPIKPFGPNPGPKMSRNVV